MKIKYYIDKFVVFLCLFLLGIFLTLQYQSAKSFADDSNRKDSSEIKEYIEKLELEREENKLLLEENEKLEKDFENSKIKYYKELNNYEIEKMLSERDILKRYSGLTDVIGEGVIVTIMDAEEITDDLELSLIHDMDIVRIINVLIENDAAAISINNERYLNASEIICSGPTVRINRNYYPAPYIIAAVGDADVIYANLEKSNIISLLRNYGIYVGIEKKDEIEISRYSGSVDWMISQLKEVEES